MSRAYWKRSHPQGKLPRIIAGGLLRPDLLLELQWCLLSVLLIASLPAKAQYDGDYSGDDDGGGNEGYEEFPSDDDGGNGDYATTEDVDNADFAATEYNSDYEDNITTEDNSDYEIYSTSDDDTYYLDDSTFVDDVDSEYSFTSDGDVDSEDFITFDDNVDSEGYFASEDDVENVYSFTSYDEVDGEDNDEEEPDSSNSDDNYDSDEDDDDDESYYDYDYSYGIAEAQEVTETVFEAIVEGANPEEVAVLLQSSKSRKALASGFTFPDERRGDLLKKTPERVGDGDVVTTKSFALAAVAQNSSATRLAKIMVLSIFPEGNATLVEEIKNVLIDKELMQKIVDADPKTQFLPTSGLRRLACNACSPVNSFVCAHCWTANLCSKFYWCPPDDKKKEKP